MEGRAKPWHGGQMEEYRTSAEDARERKGDIQKNLSMGEGGATRSRENQYCRDRLRGRGGRWDE